MKIKKKVTISIEEYSPSMKEARHKIAAYLRVIDYCVIANEVEEGRLNGMDTDGQYYWSIIFNPRGICIFDLEEREEFSE